MEANLNAIEQIWIGAVARLPENERCLPSDSRKRKGWHAFLINFFNKVKLTRTTTFYLENYLY